MKMTSGIGNKQGFALLEVLLAVVITGVSLTVIVRSLWTGWQSMAEAREYLQATMLLENKIFDLWAELSQTLSMSEGKFAEPFERFRYAIREELPTDEEGAVSRVEVSWSSGERDKSVATTIIP